MEFTAHRFVVGKLNQVPNMTPYQSGIPIDSILPPPIHDPAVKRCMKCYQSIIGSISWLASCICQYVAPVLSFLASYNNNPSHKDDKAAIHALKYLYSTADYGLSYHSNATKMIQAFNHFLVYHDKEAYIDTTPPAPGDVSRLTGFSDACWGGQLVNLAIQPQTVLHSSYSNTEACQAMSYAGQGAH
jgi:hypothetical protein